MQPGEITKWMLWPSESGPPIIILVVDDSEDDELAAVFAREDVVPSPNFAGAWGSGQQDGHWLVAFLLVEREGKMRREWFTSNLHRPLLEAVLEVPHLVAVMPAEIAGDASTAEEIAPRFGSAVILEVEARSVPVAEILAERDDALD
jgi:hypothetical protein